MKIVSKNSLGVKASVRAGTLWAEREEVKIKLNLLWNTRLEFRKFSASVCF